MEKDPKQRILDAAASLFARKGYGAVGVREIAREAGVNLSMISYYYGGKVGILKQIIQDFFREYRGAIEGAYDPQASPETNIRNIFKSVIQLLRRKADYCKVGVFEFPNDVPEIAEMKAEELRRIAKIANQFMEVLNVKDEDFRRATMVGPAILSMLFSHFLLQPVVANLTHIKFDEAYYKEYTMILTEIFLYGVLDLARRIG